MAKKKEPAPERVFRHTIESSESVFGYPQAFGHKMLAKDKVGELASHMVGWSCFLSGEFPNDALFFIYAGGPYVREAEGFVKVDRHAAATKLRQIADALSAPNTW